MTNLTASTFPSTLSATDPRAVFARAADTGRAVVAAVTPDQLDQPTPCDDFDVRTVMGHLVEVLRRIAALGRGDDPFGVDTTVADDQFLAAWDAAAREVQAAWADDATLQKTCVLPWATMDGAQTLAAFTSELTTHTWDLAVATGQRPAWDDRVLAVSLTAI